MALPGIHKMPVPGMEGSFTLVSLFDLNQILGFPDVIKYLQSQGYQVSLLQLDVVQPLIISGMRQGPIIIFHKEKKNTPIKLFSKCSLYKLILPLSLIRNAGKLFP